MMDIRHLTPTYAVSPQIACEDCKAIADAGFTTIICNRPDEEVPSDIDADAVAAAARAAGLNFVVLPITHQTMTDENIAAHRAAVDGAKGPVLAYCASGTRSSIIWSLGQAGEMDADAIIAAAGKAGYDLRGLHPQLTALAAQRKG